MEIRSETEVLALWEAAAQRPASMRSLILAGHGTSAAALADRSVGQRDAALFALRTECFGGTLECVVECPGCGAELEMDLAVRDLVVPDDGSESGSVVVDGNIIEFRAVTSRDLIMVGDRADARRTLIERCITAHGAPAGDVPLTEEMLDAVARGLAALDPQAAVCVHMVCALCAHHWAAPFDIGGYLWAELQAGAARTMRDVHQLAGAYGWSEAQVLAVSPLRRHQYLELTAP